MTVDSFSAHRQTADSVTIEGASTAVLVVDMVNDFCKEGGAMVLPGYEALVGPQNQVISAARQAGAPVVFIADTHRRHMRDEREFRKRTPHCIEGTWGAEVIDDLDRQPHDPLVIKRRYSAFFNTDLHLTLMDLKVRSVIVMGVVTNICVRSTVHDAFFLGYEVVVPEDTVAATGPREQESSLYDIATHFGTVSTAEEVAGALIAGTPIHNREAA